MGQNGINVSALANPQRNTYVRKHLTDALLGFMATRKLSEISISEICQKAGVARASFYRNFESKEDILRQHDQELIESWQKTCTAKDFFGVISSLMDHYKTNADFYRLVYENDRTIMLKDILKYSGPKPEDPNVESYRKSFLAYGVYGFAVEWFARGMHENFDDLYLALFKGEDGR